MVIQPALTVITQTAGSINLLAKFVLGPTETTVNVSICQI